uniref:Matrix-remodelling associated 5 n=1 Tax=Parascaris univalens TaxID=6257 RepID=A0A915CIG2_PARUN
IGEDERSGQPETSDEQGNIITGDSESSELGDINLHVHLLSEMKLNKPPGEDSESVPWEATKKTPSEQKIDESNGEQNKSITTTPNIDEVDAVLSESSQTEKTKTLDEFTENSPAVSQFTENSTAVSHAKATSSYAESDKEHRSHKGTDLTDSEQISTSSTARFLFFTDGNENDSLFQNETIFDQFTQVSGMSFTTTDVLPESISYSAVPQQSQVSNESRDSVGNEAVAEEKQHQAVQTAALPEVTVSEGYAVSQNTKANSVEDDGIEDISAVDIVSITFGTTETTKIPEASAVADNPFTEVTSVRTTKEKANGSYDILEITHSTNDSLVVGSPSTQLGVERDNEVTDRSEDVKASNNVRSELSKQHTSERERIEGPITGIDFGAVKAVFNMTALNNDINITEYDGLAGGDTNIRNGTSEDYDMKELTLNEPNEDYGSGEEERA